jgi:hypothetical protein
MMSRMRTITATALAGAALALAACGDSGKDESAPLTRAEFIAKTDAQCRGSNVRTKKLNEEATGVATRVRGEAQRLRELAPILERGYGQVRDNAAAFQAVNPPPDDAATVERIRKLYDQQAELVRKLAAAAKRGDAKQFTALTDQQKGVLARARKATQAYGFKECGSTKSDAT